MTQGLDICALFHPRLFNFNDQQEIVGTYSTEIKVKFARKGRWKNCMDKANTVGLPCMFAQINKYIHIHHN